MEPTSVANDRHRHRRPRCSTITRISSPTRFRILYQRTRHLARAEPDAASHRDMSRTPSKSYSSKV